MSPPAEENNSTQPHTDVFIAIHGMGDQIRKESVRDVAKLLANSLVYDPANKVRPLAPQSLGYFNTELEDYREHEGGGIACAADSPEFNQGKYATTLFAEIYWADLPRHAVKETHTLQEVKQWARTVVARANRLYQRAFPKSKERLNASQCTHSAEKEKQLAPVTEGDIMVEADFKLAGEVLDEIIETVQVLENLTFLLDKAGIFKFELKQILEDYLGDVQQVADYENVRKDIVGRFHKKMQSIHEKLTAQNDQEIRYHFIAHSEGTVVSFISMLYALKDTAFQPYNQATMQLPSEDKTETASCDWVKSVRSYMTFGSPIDKHLLLWRNMWRDFVDLSGSKDGKDTPAPWPNAIRENPIRWRNYYDVGDPVGFKLETARYFLDAILCPAFEFEGCHDHGFSRYLMPGKAHIDYWNDQEVFDHFIRDTVINPVKPLPRVDSCEAPPRAAEAIDDKLINESAQNPSPSTRTGIAFWSTTIPYALSALLMFLGIYLLYKNVTAYMHPEADTLHAWVRFQGLGTEQERPPSGWEILRTSLGMTALLAGVTICVRLPRLLRKKRWQWLSWAPLVAGCGVYWMAVSPPQQRDVCSGITHWFPALQDKGWVDPFLIFLAALVTCVLARSLRQIRAEDYQKRFWAFFCQGMRPLIIIGTAIVLLGTGLRFATKSPDLHSPAVLDQLVQEAVNKLPEESAKKTEKYLQLGLFTQDLTPERLRSFVVDSPVDAHKRLEALGQSVVLSQVEAPLWPVLLAAAAFFYLWWLSALLFDLTFVWHYYIRRNHTNTSLSAWRKRVGWQRPNSDVT